jgi:hypothetical protein
MSKFNFQKVIDNIEKVKKELPILLATDAQKYFLDSFKKEGWDGKKWEEVQRRIPGTPEYKYAKPKSGRVKPILIGTGRLKREVSLLAGNAITTFSKYNFTVNLKLNSSIVPYAGYLNNGTSKMPKRHFIGESTILSKILKNRVENYVNKIWKA